MSHWTLEGSTGSRRDDMEMLGYTILYLFTLDTGSPQFWFPNDILRSDSLQQMEKLYYKAKMSFIEETKCPKGIKRV